MNKFNAINSLTVDQLYHYCTVEQLDFKNTEQLPILDYILGQDRATEAIQFGIKIQRQGYNLFVMGPPGCGKQTLVRQLLEKEVLDKPLPSDWCYVHNFTNPQMPQALELPAGRGIIFKQDLTQLIQSLKNAMTFAFENPEYIEQVDAIEDEIKQRQKYTIEKIKIRAEKQKIHLLRTSDGFVFAPSINDETLDPEQFNQLPKKQQQSLEKIIEAFQEELRKTVEQFPTWAKQSHIKIDKLNRATSMLGIRAPIDEIKQQYSDLPNIITHLEEIEPDILETLLETHTTKEGAGSPLKKIEQQESFFTRYSVNLLINHHDSQAAPIIYEDQPSYQNLIGKVEHLSQMGTLITNFTLIKPGALHRANGGYLIIDAEKILSEPHAWQALKRTLKSATIGIDSLSQLLSLNNTASLDPEKIPLNIKVILLGDRHLYHLLNQYDPEFEKLFKVVADFEDEIDRDINNTPLFARYIATICHHEKIMPLEAAAVARVIEYSSRIAEHNQKLTTHLQILNDLLCEADYFAHQNSKQNNITAENIEQALQQQQRRENRVAEYLHDEVIQGDIHISTNGMKIGQINGLTVISLSNHMFGQPSRITATTRLGEGDIMDIEREAELAGPIHAKGVMILTSYIGHRYSRNRPLAMHASIVFEQSYGMIEGDSASLAELCALLSSIAEVPISQGFAITGSVNQLGEVQPIGGVNEKIEGYFDICKRRGLDGHQKVIIPHDNIKHLMLKHEVLDAVKQGKFHIYGVKSVDEAISLLMSIDAGCAELDGEFPEGSFNHIVTQKLLEFAVIRQTFGDIIKEAEE